MKKLLLLTIISLSIISCKKEDTVWESDWATPLINDTLSLKNLVNDSTWTESGGFYVLDLKRTIIDMRIAEFVEIPDTSIVELFTFSGTLNLSPGFNFVNSAEEHSINTNEVQLKKIVLKEGFIDVKVENPLGTKTIFNVTLPGVSKAGVTFNNVYEAPAGSTSNPGVAIETIDLSGYELDMTGLTGGEYNILRSQITVATDPNGPTVTITPADITKLEATFRDVKVDYARGYFGNQLVTDTSELFIDFMNNIQAGAIDIPNTSVAFEIENGLKVSAQGILTTVTNENSQGSVISLSNPQIGNNFNINPATGTWNTLSPSFTTLEFNSSNSNIESYIENLGARHTLGYSMQLNPWGNTSGGWDEVFPSSRIAIKMLVNMPLNIGLDGILLKDTFDISLNQDPGKTHVLSGELILEASNGFPIQGTIGIQFLDANGTLLHTIAGTNPIQSSEYGSLHPSFNIKVMDSELHFVLPEEVVSDIDYVKQIVVESTFNTINPSSGMNEQMNVPVGAFLGIKLKSKFKTENRF